MSYRFMRVLVFFDLPTLTNADRKEYRRFRTFLVKKGFLMLQESVYCKLALNYTVVTSVLDVIKQNSPSKGVVQVLTVTEKQFSRMEFISGETSSTVIDSDSRLVLL